MSNFVDLTYINQISLYLEQFTKVSDNTYRFRCPFCGDSKKSQTKTRGHFYMYEGNWRFKCHNCHHPSDICGVIEKVSPALVRQYKFDKFKASNGNTARTQTQKKKHTIDSTLFKKKEQYLNSPLGKLKKISQLSSDHVAKQYITQRQIPNDRHYELFYTNRFRELVNEFIPDKFDKPELKDRRIVIPFLDANSKLVALQGRTLDNHPAKYITISLDDNAVRYYGMNRVDFRKRVYVLEGPFDSMFIDNAIAQATLPNDNRLSEVYPRTEFVFLFDNQYRNRDVKKAMRKIIAANHSIVLLPNAKYDKDINEMILTGMNQSDIMNLLGRYTFRGLEAQTNFNFWENGIWQ